MGHKEVLAMMSQVCNPSTKKGEMQGCHSKFKASLGYMRLSGRETNKQIT